MRRNIFDQNPQREIKNIGNVFGEFLVNKGLYDEIEITQENIFELSDLVGGHVKINVYCPECKEKRVFSCEEIPHYIIYDNNQILCNSLADEITSWQSVQKSKGPGMSQIQTEPWTWKNNGIENDTRIMVFKFICAMDNSHHLDYIVITNENKMKKIGQFPSFADLSFPELKEYKNVIGKENEKELKRAIGLYASGIGVGSFVYLRRIFERIIMTAGKNAIDDGNVTQEEFDRARIDEKIKMISMYIPKLLTENRIVYGIISKGIHELSEEECLEFFPVMKNFIIMILRQWEKTRRDEEDEKKIRASISSISSKLN